MSDNNILISNEVNTFKDTNNTNFRETLKDAPKDNNIQLFTNKKEEIRFFLREYSLFEGEKFDFYYIIPYKWLKQWDSYITDPNDTYPDRIDNSHLLDENSVIRQNLIENVDYVIVPKSLGYFFHDVYQGGRRLKTKNRHIYAPCEKTETCDKHDLKNHLKVFDYMHLLEEEKKFALDENRKMRRDECHIFSWC